MRIDPFFPHVFCTHACICMQLHRAPPPRLQVFGKVVEGMDIVKAIESSPTGPGDKPIEPIVVNTIEISES